MKVFITGGCGLLGSHVAKHLKAQGHEVVLFDLVLRQEIIKRLGDVPAYRGDVLDMPAVLRALRESKPEVIVHTASLLTPASIGNPYMAAQINYLGTVAMLEAARLEGVAKLCFCSSRTVYDTAVDTGHPIREDHPLEPRSIYATTKIASEFTGRNYKSSYGVNFVACRFASLFGPSASQSGTVGKWLDPLVNKLLKGEPAQVERPARKFVEYIYVEDAARALVAVATHAKNLEPAYNIAEGRLVSFDEMLDAVRAVIPGAVITEAEHKIAPTPYVEAVHHMDTSSAQRDLDFSVHYPMEVAIRDYIGRIKSGDI